MDIPINAVLHYGYHPGCSRGGLPKSVVDAAEADTITVDYDSLVSRTADAIRSAVDNELQIDDGEGPQVVPLSSGLDSRTILAALLEHPSITRSDIRTISFGMPGTWDYEIGQLVAEEAGVENLTLSLRDENFDWSLDALQHFAETIDNPIRLFGAYVNSEAASLIDKGVIWSGFMGEATAGDHLQPDLQHDWDAVCSYFATDHQYTTGLTAPEFNPTMVLPKDPYLPSKIISYEDQLDFGLRQQCFIAPAVIHSSRYRIPFIQSSWLCHILNVPNKHRIGRQLFIDTVLSEFPELFALPTDANAGLPLATSKPRTLFKKARLKLSNKVSNILDIDYYPPDTNYLDFDAAFRQKGQLRDTARQLLYNLSDRDCAQWISPEEIWQKHQDGFNKNKEIRVLASLELYLETHDEQY